MKDKLISRVVQASIVAACSCLSLAPVTLLGDEGVGDFPRFEVDASPPDRQGPLGGYSAVIEKVSPGIVSITTKKKLIGVRQSGPFFYDPNSGRFLRRVVPQQSEAQPIGSGSGVIISGDGYIVTNRHVIAQGDEFQVGVGEKGDLFNARVVGMDKATDVAVLKIDQENLAALKIGDSSLLKTGDVVLALGSPFGLERSVTSGIVSALGRTGLGITGPAGYEDFIQTDASINPGNSGGALVDNRGRLVGINTAIFSRSGGNQGIGFAIPSNLVMNVAKQLIRHGKVVRGTLGVRLGEITQELSEAMGIARDGCIIHEVISGSPAQEAGIEAGDVVMAFGGKTVKGAAEMRLMVGAALPGSEVDFKIKRDGREMVLKAKIGGDSSYQATAGSIKEKDDEFLEGVTLAELSDSLREGLSLPSEIDGIVIDRVEAGTPAAQSGLKAGDVICEVARVRVKSIKEAFEAKEKSDKDVLLLRVLGREGSRFVAVDLS